MKYTKAYGQSELPSASLTIGQLREALAPFPDDAPVIVDGCDCFGEVARVRWYDPSEPDVVVIEREHGHATSYSEEHYRGLGESK